MIDKNFAKRVVKNFAKRVVKNFAKRFSLIFHLFCLVAHLPVAPLVLAQEVLTPAQQDDPRLTSLELPSRETSRARALRDESLALAQQVRALKRLTARLDKHLKRLSDREQRERENLFEQYDRLAQVLQTLLFLERSPEGGLFLHPDNALAAHRGQRLAAWLAPHSARTARLLESDLRRIGALQREIDRKKEQLSAHLEEVAAYRQRIARLASHKLRLLPLTVKERAALKKRAHRLGEEAKSVQALVMRLDRETLTHGGGAPRNLRVFPEVSDKRKLVVLPAEGTWLKRYGSSDGYGQTLRGIVIATDPATVVLAAFDGRVVFAETFRDQGKLLIVEHKGGYHTVTAHLSKIFVSLGQWVLAGEPVGGMGAKKGRLYFEVRQGGKPLNPQLWIRETPRLRAFLLL